MAEGRIILDFCHPDGEKYPNQRIMIVEINEYPYCIPYIQEKDRIILKTIYPDRRFKKFLKHGEKNE
jgi:hypothetical protein